MKPLKPSDIQTIFETARVNGGTYIGDHLLSQRWEWPRGWFSRRLEHVRNREREADSEK